MGNKGDKTMKPIECYKKLESKSLPIIEAYQKDLLCWDKQAIFRSPDTQFIHFTRKTGTHIIFFHPVDKYPARGENVKYLFSYADRWHILDQVIDSVNYMIDKSSSELILYYNGKTLKEIDPETARSLTQEYHRKTRNQFS